jgi:hypothetical protein
MVILLHNDISSVKILLLRQFFCIIRINGAENALLLRNLIVFTEGFEHWLNRLARFAPGGGEI